MSISLTGDGQQWTQMRTNWSRGPGLRLDGPIRRSPAQPSSVLSCSTWHMVPWRWTELMDLLWLHWRVRVENTAGCSDGEF